MLPSSGYKKNVCKPRTQITFPHKWFLASPAGLSWELHLTPNNITLQSPAPPVLDLESEMFTELKFKSSIESLRRGPSQVSILQSQVHVKFKSSVLFNL